MQIYGCDICFRLSAVRSLSSWKLENQIHKKGWTTRLEKKQNKTTNSEQYSGSYQLDRPFGRSSNMGGFGFRSCCWFCRLAVFFAFLIYQVWFEQHVGTSRLDSQIQNVLALGSYNTSGLSEWTGKSRNLGQVFALICFSWPFRLAGTEKVPENWCECVGACLLVFLTFQCDNHNLCNGSQS